MKNIFFLLVLAISIGYSQTDTKTITGRVSDGRVPLPNVNITVEGKETGTVTDNYGYYSIKAQPGDILNYTHQGLKTLQIVVEDVTEVLNPVLFPDAEELDEVVVVGNNRKSQADLAMEYETNPRIIRTAYGYLNADTAPGNVRFLYMDQISPVGLCILDVLRGYFAGVRVVGSCAGTSGNFDNRQQISAFGAVFIRGVSSISIPRSAIFDVDGQIFTIPPVWIDVNNMKRIAILNNFATVTQYGSIATGGVVVINTVSGSKGSGQIVDYARLKNNYFNEDEVLGGDRILQNGPNYLKDLVATDDDEAAMKAYEDWAQKFGSSPYFVLDAYRHFYEVREDPEFADGIIERNWWKFKENPVLLKALAYHYEAQERFTKAHEIYKAVYRLRPEYRQSFLDLANSYRNIGEVQKAAAIYSRYRYIQDTDLMARDTTEFKPIIEREDNNLLSLHRNEIMASDNADDLFVVPEDYFQGTRLVFEWNDGEAEFDLQFVNPGDQYYTFRHSLAHNNDLIMREKLGGFSTTEFLIDNSLPGEWKINAAYLGNKRLYPSYLKATIYYNYGTRAQRKEVKVFKLGLKGKNVALFRVANGSSVVAK